MSINVDTRIVDRGSDEYVDEAWELKERIRRSEGVLRQRRRFFENAYRRSKVYVYLNRARQTKLIGFAAVRRDGYMLFLAVNPTYRNQGYGKRLVAHAVEDHNSVSCHARTTNESAMEFYEGLGFEVERRINNYYEDGGDAFYLTLGSDGGIFDRLQSILGR